MQSFEWSEWSRCQTGTLLQTHWILLVSMDDELILVSRPIWATLSCVHRSIQFRSKSPVQTGCLFLHLRGNKPISLQTVFSLLHSRHCPVENAWFLLLKFQTSGATFMAGDEFLLPLKLTNRVTTSSKARAEGLHFGKKPEQATGCYSEDRNNREDWIY